MKILILGAAGKTGRAVVQQAVAAGHQVTAFVRKGEEFSAESVRIVEGDATSNADVDVAVMGQDAVVDTIGGKTPYKETTLETSAADAIIASMHRNKVRRLVVTSMVGVGDSEANATLPERLLVSTLLRGADKDKTSMESAVRASELDWVIVRPAILNDDPAKGDVRAFTAETGEKAHKITRADVASFLVAQLSSNEYLHQAVTIANT